MKKDSDETDRGTIDFKKPVREMTDAGFDATITFEAFSEDSRDQRHSLSG